MERLINSNTDYNKLNEFLRMDTRNFTNFRGSLSGRAYMETAKRLLGDDVDVTIPGKKEGFWGKVKSTFGGK